MNKKHVVFVSSTYTDLVEERQAVSKALLRSNCFPSQMENWPAMDAEQMVAIRELIDECDYYLVLAAGKYGSTNEESGLSYTELEYDYAVSIGKPIIRLLHKNPFDELRGDQIELHPEKKRKLQKFRTKLKTGSVCSFWTSPENLMTETILSLHDIISRHPTDGWIRAKTAEAAQDQKREIALIDQLVKNIRSQSTGLTGTLDELPIPVLNLDAEGIIVSSNAHAKELLNLSDETQVPLSNALEGLGISVSDWIRAASTDDNVIRSELLRARLIKNREVFVQVNLSYTKMNEGRKLLAVLTDVSELKALEAQFVQSQKMQAIGQLAGGVAHDFNNLLTAISGYCDLLLLRHDAGDPDYADLIQIAQNSNRAASLVGQLLAFSRKQNLKLQSLDVRNVMSDLAHLLNRLIGEKISLEVSHSPGAHTIRGDRRQIEQVFVNLIVNARDAMPNGGTIQVISDLQTLPEEMVRDQARLPPGEYVRIRVQDGGVGIPAQDISKVFEPFFSTKKPGEGTGLGLSTAYGIVKQTGGYIFVDSREGEGTEFSLYFPFCQMSVEAGSIDKELTSTSVQGEGVVLVVEDEAPVRAFASRALRLRGYIVIEAEDGEEALAILEDDDLQIDLFLSDVIMPGRDGPTWVRQAIEKRPETKVIFMSGYVDEANDKFRRLPFASIFLPKPFSLHQLTSLVHKSLSSEHF